MQYKSVKGFTGWGQLGFLFVFLGVGFMLAAFAQFLLTAQIMPKGTAIDAPGAMMKAMLDPANVKMAQTIQATSTFLLLFIPAILWSMVSNGKNMFWLGFNKYINGRQILLGFLIIFTAGIFANTLGDLSKNIIAHFPALDKYAAELEKINDALTKALSNLKSWPEFIIALFIMAFFPAVFEEAFFRGAMQNLLVKWLRRPYVGIIITSIVFSIVHGSIYLFPGRFFLGFVLGLMFYETKNIWVNIFAHFINNTLALIGMFALSRQGKQTAADNMDPHLHWSVGVLSLAVLAALFIFLRKFSVLNKAKIDAKENLLIAAADPFRSFTDTEINSGGHQ